MSAHLESLEAIGRTYGLFAKGLDYPDAAFWESLEGNALRELASGWDDIVGMDAVAHCSFPRRDQEAREIEFVSTFDQGGVPLYEGLCLPKTGREGIFDEVLRFYHHFGLRLSETQRDFPDNFVTELEFMGHLVRLEAGAIERGASPEAFRRAQRDFLTRHLGLWAEALPERLRQYGEDTAYYLLAVWLRGFVEAHLESLNGELADSCGTSPGGELSREAIARG